MSALSVSVSRRAEVRISDGVTGSSLGANYFYGVGAICSGGLPIPPTKGAPLPSFCLLTEPVSAVLFWDVADPYRNPPALQAIYS